MRTLSVDLASKFSAYQVRDGREVLAEADSAGVTPFDLAKKIRRMADEFAVDLLMVENIAPQMQYQIDRVLRLQGIIALACHPYVSNDTLRLIQPQTWQKEFPGVGSIPKGVEVPKARRDDWRAEEARKHALRLGYSPPDLVGAYIDALPEGKRALVKDTKPLAKSMTDYVDAFLIGEWCQRRTTQQIDATSGVTPFLI